MSSGANSLVLPALQEQVLRSLIRQAPLKRTAEFFEFAGDPPGVGSNFVAVVRHGLNDDIHMVVTLGALSRHLFIAGTDAYPKDVATALGNIEVYDATKARLTANSCVRLENDFARRFGRVAAQILRPEDTGPLARFPEFLEVSGFRFHCLWVVFLTEKEFDLQRAKGLFALVEEFERTNRDMVHLEALPTPV